LQRAVSRQRLVDLVQPLLQRLELGVEITGRSLGSYEGLFEVLDAIEAAIDHLGRGADCPPERRNLLHIGRGLDRRCAVEGALEDSHDLELHRIRELSDLTVNPFR
jgi:hypothetical protein